MTGGGVEVDGWRVALRWVAAPPTVLALLVLVLNDHVWKQQWPGTVTGKVSDAAWLMVVPPVLALPLALAGRVRHQEAFSLWGTAMVFTLVKTSTMGAAVASDMLSLVTPSYVRADLTDLLTLPALVVAARTASWARHAPVGSRRRAVLAAGALILPVAVVATTATSPCEEHGEACTITAVTGRLESTPAGFRQDFIVEVNFLPTATIVDGQIRPLSEKDELRTRETQRYYQFPFSLVQRQACSLADASRCWRLPTQGRPLIEASEDGGRTWRPDYAPSREEVAQVVEDMGEKCGKAARYDTLDLAVADTDRGPVVATTLAAAGVAVRASDGRWSRLPLPAFYAGQPSPSPMQPTGRIRPVDPVPTYETPKPPYPTPTRTSSPPPSATRS